MHEELDRPSSKDTKAATCSCTCNTAGEDAATTRQSNFAAVENKIGG